ncbi:MAG: acyl-CoA thioesterase [Desulfobacteraceae bacterium]|nr:acyl-CoA thioesterase [Desulfobacteraceae bacterium]
MKLQETHVQVRFNEIDAYNVAWHGHYVAWMEVGRNDLAGRFGMDARQLAELGYLGPVVSLEVKYLSPARFKDDLVVRTTLRPTEAATLVFLNEIVSADGRKLATGVTTHALTDLNGIMQFKLPAILSERIDNMLQWLNNQ